jgi:uncharacterized protein YcbK (DUF882 family)
MSDSLTQGHALTRRSVMTALLMAPSIANAQVAISTDRDSHPISDIDMLKDQPAPSLDQAPKWQGFGTPTGPAAKRLPEGIQNFAPRTSTRFAGIQRHDLAELTRKAPRTKANLPALRGLWLQNPRTNEEIMDVFWQNAAYDPAAYGRVCHLMRDWRENITSAMDPKLLHILWAVQNNIGFERPIMITSGFRTVRTNSNLEGAAVHSYHLRSQASDIVVPGVAATRIAEYVHSWGLGGVGFYARFTHIDSGPRRTWES